MKKIICIFLPLIFLVLIISSCNKEKDPVSTTEKFSTATVEQNKASVEDAGIELVTTMSDMKSIESVGVIVNLGDILSSAGGPAKKGFLSRENKLVSTLETFAAAAKGEKKVNDVYKSMIAPKELAGDPETLQQFWDANTGTYTWNPGLSDFDIALNASLDKVVFLFPSSDVSTTNDATLTIYNYAGIVPATPIDSSYTGDMPVSLNADLKVGSKVLISMTFAASYNSDGTPKSVASDLTVESYKFEIDITNSTQAASVNYKFLAGTKVIMDMGASGEGLFTQANFDNNTHTTVETNTYGYYDYQWNPATMQYDQVWVEYTDTWESTETDFEEILHSAKAHFQLFNIAIRGDIIVKGLVDEIKKIEDKVDNESITSVAGDSLSVIELNKNLNLRLVNATTNEIMAKAEAYVKKEIRVDYVDSYVDFRLTFADGSPVDAATYFDNGFGDFVTELNKLIADLNTEYSLQIEPAVY